jgi:hypothetical protein
MVNRSRITRRRLLLSTAAACVPASCAADVTLDEALVRLHPTDVEFDGGLANHGPMAVEALSELGNESEIGDFLEEYEGRLLPLPGGTPLSQAQQAGALGNFDERGNWIATFEAQLGAASPTEVIAQHWSALAPGISAAGFHGLLRTGHALRSLGRVDNATRRRELAHGLGFWAARHQPLAGTPGAQTEAGLDVGQALARVPLLTQPSDGLISARIAAVDASAEFAAAMEVVDLDALPVAQALGVLTSMASRLYYAAAEPAIAQLHAITGTSAFRFVLPHLTEAQQREGLGYVYQVVAAIYATSAAAPGVPAPPSESEFDADELRDCAADNLDAHAIKLAEVGLREHALDPRTEYLAAGGRLID